MLCMPWVPLESISVLHCLLEVPGLLLSSCLGRGRRWGFLQWVLSSALVSPLIAVNDPGNQLGALTSDYSAERGTCASGAFMLVCPTEVMDKSRGCSFLSDQLNLPLAIAWNTTCVKLDKLSSCAAVCVYPKVTSSEGFSAWVQCEAKEQDPTCGLFLRKKKRGKTQWTPGGQPKWFAAFSPALTNNPLQEK